MYFTEFECLKLKVILYQNDNYLKTKDSESGCLQFCASPHSKLCLSELQQLEHWP